MPGTPAEDDDDTRQELARLRAAVDALREEVRTRRLVVVDSSGRPRVTVAAEPGSGSVRVDAEGGDPSVELYAVDALDGDGPEIGVVLVVGGDVERRISILLPADRGSMLTARDDLR